MCLLRIDWTGFASTVGTASETFLTRVFGVDTSPRPLPPATTVAYEFPPRRPEGHYCVDVALPGVCDRCDRAMGVGSLTAG